MKVRIMGQEYNYKIISFNEQIHSITVLFEGFDNPVDIYLPLHGDEYPSGEYLDRYIMGFDPAIVLKVAEANRKNIKNVDYIKSLVTPIEMDDIALAKDARYQRDYRLLMSDWLVLPDTGFTDEAVTRFKKYRQELRDVPQQSGFPRDIAWPDADGEWMNNPTWR